MYIWYFLAEYTKGHMHDKIYIDINSSWHHNRRSSVGSIHSHDYKENITMIFSKINGLALICIRVVIRMGDI